MCDKDGPHYQYSPDKENVPVQSIIEYRLSLIMRSA